MRLVYTADLHGHIASYRSLLDLAVATGAQAAIVGGDLLPHAIRLQGAIEFQRDFIATQLRPLLAAFRARQPGVAVYLLAGNDDWAGAIAALDDLEREGLALPLHERVYPLVAPGGGQGLWLAGYACVPLTPFSIKDYERRDDRPLPPFSFDMAYQSWGGEIRRVDGAAIEAWPSIDEALAALARQSDPRRTIYVCHTPPSDTPLDQMPRDKHVGSRALRAFIERHAPPLTLHGHIHEAPQITGRYTTRLGDTWSVNPGHVPRRFQAVSLDTDDIAGTIEHTVFGRLNV
ncbi:MAG: metallophosphoesterase [Kouleothrix sp.]|nr:metallophosphoesterase [Kouleothrix sp.]